MNSTERRAGIAAAGVARCDCFDLPVDGCAHCRTAPPTAAAPPGPAKPSASARQATSTRFIPEARTTINIGGETVDLIAVERVITGGWPRPPLTAAERLHAVRVMHAHGCAPTHIARVLGVSGSTAEALIEQAQRAGTAKTRSAIGRSAA